MAKAPSQSARTKPKAKKKAATRKAKPGASKGATAARKKKFVESFVANGGNATQAGIDAGYSPKTAYSQGARLLKDVEILAQIDARRTELSNKYELTTETLIRSMARAVFFDPRKLYDENGQLKAITDLDDDTADALTGIEVTFERVHGKDTPTDVVTGVKKYKWLDKNTAREQANKHLGLYEKDNKQKPQIIERIERIIVEKK